MWIVRLALRRPYTFVVTALLILVIAAGVVRRTPTDIFPDIDIPVITVVWTYTGLPAPQMERQITQFSEYSLAGNVGGIHAIESQSFDGVSVIRLLMEDDVDVATATAQVTAISQTIVRRMPAGTQPPIIVRSSASSVPILQLAFTSDQASEAELYDYVNLRVRSLLSTVHGTRFPLPAGGRQRLIVVDLDPAQLRAIGLSANEVALAVSNQNLTLPTGSAKVGETEYRVSMNSSPERVADLNEVPIRTRDGRSIRVGDVAFVHDGFAPQTNIARRDGQRAVVLSVLKTGDASTLEVAQRIRAMIPMLRAAAPPGVRLELLADQSTFVSHAVRDLLTEGIIAALLTAAMILVFLGSWRSTLIVFVSIPLSVAIALLAMRALGQTINTMTLGGLALAVGILVDDATVEIENIHRNLAMGKALTRAILDGAEQVAVPAFVASLSIGLVFFSVFLLEGPARYLFAPLGMAVGFSVMASYLLSRTVVPTMVRYLLPAEIAHHARTHGLPPRGFARAHAAFERAFEALRARYADVLGVALRHRALVLLFFVVASVAGGFLATRTGRDFFPRVDAGQIRLHVTAPPGTRIEETERYFAAVEDALREIIPADERELVLDQIGMPSGYSLAVSDSATVSSSDGEILLRLHQHHRVNTERYVEQLRRELPRRFPELSFYFQPADIVTQILNFGLPSPIAVQVSGQQRDATLATARALARDLGRIRGVVDVRVHQVTNAPRLHIEVDRRRAGEVGLTQRDVAADVLLAVSSSGQVAPSYWIDPTTGNSYPVVVQVPEQRVDSFAALQTLSLASPRGPQMLGDLARMERREAAVLASHYDLQPTFEVRADVQSVDLGAVAGPIEAVVARYRRGLPPGSTATLKGQIESMEQAYTSLALGLALATLLVYGLMVINFQSWTDPFIILMALPGAGAGIVLGLLLTGTTFSVPALMGAVMSVGVATANSTLLVSFANELRESGRSALDAALEAGRVRLRPVVMTALAMVIGMLPMALNRAGGGEQNASLARAVIGGLGGATLTTLLLVPVVYSLLRRKDRVRAIDPDLDLDEPGPREPTHV